MQLDDLEKKVTEQIREFKDAMKQHVDRDELEELDSLKTRIDALRTFGVRIETARAKIQELQEEFNKRVKGELDRVTDEFNEIAEGRLLTGATSSASRPQPEPEPEPTSVKTSPPAPPPQPVKAEMEEKHEAPGHPAGRSRHPDGIFQVTDKSREYMCQYQVENGAVKKAITFKGKTVEKSFEAIAEYLHLDAKGKDPVAEIQKLNVKPLTSFTYIVI